MTATLAIYDLDEVYANSLIKYINQKQNMPFKATAFTNKEALEEYLQDNHIDILLVDYNLYDEYLELEDVSKIIFLVEDDCQQFKDYSYIYKFQSSENIIRKILDYFAELNISKTGSIAKRNGTKIVGVYSPIKKPEQTVFAFTVGQVLAESGSTLYINMDEFTAFDKIYHQNYQGDLSDLMYYFKQNKDTVAIKLKAIVNTVNTLDYVPPLKYSRDLRTMETTKWIELLETIMATGMYENIVIDIGNVVEDITSLIEFCDKIYVPMENSYMYKMKVGEFEEFLLRSEASELIDKIEQVTPPIDLVDIEDDNFLERQLWSNLGDYSRQVVGGGGNR